MNPNSNEENDLNFEKHVFLANKALALLTANKFIKLL